MAENESGKVGIGVRSPVPEQYNPVRDALRELTYADKTGIVYFSLSAVRSETRGDIPKTFIEMHSQLENLVSRGIAYKIVGKMGLNRKVVRLYRHK